jgi:hypothetical protein
MGRIFTKLSWISIDSVPEIRHSAIHIFTNLLLHLNSENNRFDYIFIFFLFYRLKYKVGRIGRK